MDPTKSTSAGPYTTQQGARHTTGETRPPLSRSDKRSLVAIEVRAVQSSQRSTLTAPTAVDRLPTPSQHPSAVPTASMLNTLATGGPPRQTSDGAQPSTNPRATTQGQRHQVVEPPTTKAMGFQQQSYTAYAE